MKSRALAGLVAGFSATIPMTLAMHWMHRRLPEHQRHSLPPRKITMAAARKADIHHEMSEPTRTLATYAAHFGFGATAGTLMGAVFHKLPGPPLLRGIGTGLCVWAGSYLGWLPAAGLHRAATREPPPRNALMIVAHIIWGAAAGGIMQMLEHADGSAVTRSAANTPTSSAHIPATWQR